MEENYEEVLLMTKIIDFSECDLSPRNLEYGGRAGEKKGIHYDGGYWFLKFPKNTIGMNKVKGLSYVTSPLSEYIGSQIYRILGYDVHRTVLGICFDGKRYKVVCACKDFIDDDKNEMLIPYTSLRNDTNPRLMERDEDLSLSASNINEIILQLEHNTVLSQIKNARERFWDVVVIDVLINNNDRNEDNWGVIKYKKEDKYKLAPIFDCGNSFYGKTSNERIKEILSAPGRLLSSAINGVTAYETDDERRIRAQEILYLANVDLQSSITKVYELIIQNIGSIIDFINSVPEYYNDIEIMSAERKDYYIKTLQIRIDKLLYPRYLEIASKL